MHVVSLEYATAGRHVLEAGNMAERDGSETATKRPSSLCFCSAKKTVHVHCTCTSCNGKPVNYRTQLSHLEFERKFEAANAVNLPGKLSINKVLIYRALKSLLQTIQKTSLYYYYYYYYYYY